MIYLTRKQPYLGLLFILSIAAFNQTAMGLVIHSDTLHIALDYINPQHKKHETLVILDIDNVQGHPATADGLGSDQWFKEMVKVCEKQGHATESAINQVLPLYFAIHHHYPLQPVELTTSSCIKCLQTKAQVMSLTARSPEFSERTVEQLENIDINFSKLPVHNTALKLHHTHSALFYQGILFGGNNNKGDILIMFLETINYIPKKIIFVDDKEHNIHAVEKAAQSKNIDFVGIRHSKLDKKVENFNLGRVQVQQQAFMQKHSNTIAHYKKLITK